MHLRFLIPALLPALSSHAGTASSASYSNHAATFDTGGTGAASASYSARTSVGVPGWRTGSSMYLSKGGFPGSIYYPATVELFTIPPCVAETEPFQLNAREVMDDFSFLPIPASRVEWEIVKGPVSPEIGPDGSTKASEVWEDSTAVIAAKTAAGPAALTLTIHDIFPDNFGIYAADGLADAWQVKYFGTDNKEAQPAMDPDADGAGNAAEFSAGTNPLDPSSVFNPAAGGNAAQLTIRFDSIPGHHYQLEASTTMAPGSWIPDGTPLAGTGSALEFIIPAPIGSTRLFYRVIPGP